MVLKSVTDCKARSQMRSSLKVVCSNETCNHHMQCETDTVELDQDLTRWCEKKFLL